MKCRHLAIFATACSLGVFLSARADYDVLGVTEGGSIERYAVSADGNTWTKSNDVFMASTSARQMLFPDFIVSQPVNSATIASLPKTVEIWDFVIENGKQIVFQLSAFTARCTFTLTLLTGMKSPSS